MKQTVSRRRLLLGIGAGLCARSLQSAQPATVLDRGTGATVTHSAKPWILFLDHPHLASNTRDYIAFYATEVNVAGQRSYLLSAFIWSTIAGRARFAGEQPVLSLRVDDRVVKLSPSGKTPRDWGISRWPVSPPGRGALFVAYEVDLGLLQQMGTAASCRARPETDASLPADVWFETWQQARGAFAAFAKSVLA